MPTTVPTLDVSTALRLGWAVAEARGRSWPGGPRPDSTRLPLTPEDVLPLRPQRDLPDSKAEAVATLEALAGSMQVSIPDRVRTGLHEEEPDWADLGSAFVTWDGELQAELATSDEALANGYLLGRGLAECYWGLGHRDQWEAAPGLAPAFLFGDDRVNELTRMLGRLSSTGVDAQTPAAIAGSLEAWRAVAGSSAWSGAADLPKRLYQQVRVWYQLLVLEQDPTTLIRPGARIASLQYLLRAGRTFLLHGVLALVPLVFTAVVLVVHPETTRLTSVLATGGFGAFALAGLLARGQNAAQQLVSRLHQDAYTDLIAVSVAVVPDPPHRWLSLDRLVHQRRLTPPTPAPAAAPAAKA